MAGALYEREDVQTALARGDWAKVLRAFLDAGLSQTAIADRSGLSQSQVSRLVNGRTRDPGIQTVKALLDGLEIPRWLFVSADQDYTESDTDRRQFLHVSLGTAATLLMPQGDVGDVEDERLVLATTRNYRQLEQHTPSRDLLQPITAHLTLARTLALRSSGKRRLRMSAALSEVAGLAAWVHADLGDAGRTRRLYAFSVAAANESGQSLLTTYMQGSFGQYATSAGDPIYGIRIIRDAAARLPRSAPNRARSWLAAMEGVTLAHLGDRDALRQLDQAQRYADAARDEDPVWPWVFRFGDEKIAQNRAIAAARLGFSTQAAAAFGRAQLAATGSPKQTATADVEFARSLVAAGELEEACRIAEAAFDTGAQFGSERVCQAVREFHHDVATPANRARMSDLDDRLRSRYSGQV